MSTDKLEQHYGLQLSALMDGELAPDQARFLLRRLQHDGELADSWERWQLAGEVLRGRAGVLLPAGFAERVGVALRTEPVPAAAVLRAPGLLRWGGGVAALAASVAVVALMLPRQAPDAPVQDDVADIVTAPDTGRRNIVEAPAVEPPVEPAVADAPAATPVRAVASRAAPSRAVDRGRASSRPQAPAVAEPMSTPSRRIADAVAATPASHLALPVPNRDPFSDAPLASRPWPRAVLPQLGSGGTLAAGLPADAQSPSFYPFEPRLPAQADQPAPDAPPQAPY